PANVAPRGTLNRSQSLLELARKLTRASSVGIGLVSADGQLVEHLTTDPAPERTEAASAWVVALAEWAHRPAAEQGSAGPPRPPLSSLAEGPFLAIPLNCSDRCPGVLYAMRAVGETPFGADDLESARLIGACFEQGNLFEEAHLLTRLQVLNQ